MKPAVHHLTLAILAASTCHSAQAHHSAAAFDTSKETTITGTVTQYSFRNPHVYMTLAVTQEDGSIVETEVEAGAGSVLGPLGFTRDSVKVGDVVNIVGNPGRRDPEGLMLGKELYKQDGSYIPLHINSRSIYDESEESAESIAGTWFSPRTSFFAILGSAGQWQTTDKGKAAIAAASGAATPQKDCIPIGRQADDLFGPRGRSGVSCRAGRVVRHLALSSRHGAFKRALRHRNGAALPRRLSSAPVAQLLDFLR